MRHATLAVLIGTLLFLTPATISSARADGSAVPAPRPSENPARPGESADNPFRYAGGAADMLNMTATAESVNNPRPGPEVSVTCTNTGGKRFHLGEAGYAHCMDEARVVPPTAAQPGDVSTGQTVDFSGKPKAR